MKQVQTNSYLETQGVPSLMAKYALPCIISLLVGALYNIVDQIFIANADYLGSYGNAANSVVFPLTVIALAIATMIGDGCCSYVSTNLGSRNTKEAAQSVGSAVSLIIISSIVLTAIYLVFMNPILIAFGATVNKETFELSREYFFWIALGIPFYMFGQAINPIIRSDGSPGFAMFSLTAGAVCNCILDPIFIFIFKWGMTGAAAATVLGQILSAVMAVIYLFNTKAVQLEKTDFKLRKKVIKKICSLGAASFLAQISIVMSMAAVLNMCRKYGALDPIFGMVEYAQIPTAVTGIVMKFFQIIISIAIGLSAGCIPIVGYNIGAKRSDRAAELLKYLLAAEFFVGIIATVIFEAFPQQLINIFGAKKESIHYTNFAIHCIHLFLCATPLACFNKGVFIYLQALGKAAASTALSMLREVVFGVGLVLILPIFFGLEGILYFMAIADILTFIASLAAVKMIFRRLSEPSYGFDGYKK